MRPSRILTVAGFLALGAFGLAFASTETPRDGFVSTDLCLALETIEPGQRLAVEVEGIYLASAEHSVLYPADGSPCTADVQPAVWVDFASPVTIPEEFRERIDGRDPTRVKFRGYLVAPEALPADDLSLPVLAAHAKRTQGQRFGHLNAFRLAFEVVSIVDPDRFEIADAPTFSFWEQPPYPSQSPRVLDARLPQYPRLAWHSGIEGRVLAEVAIQGGAVVEIEILAGERILAESTRENIESWIFEPETTTRFRTTFVYEVEPRLRGRGPNPTVEMDLPHHVRLTAPRNGW